MSEERKNKAGNTGRAVEKKDHPKPLAKKSWIGENKADIGKFRKAMEIPKKPVKPKTDK